MVHFLSPALRSEHCLPLRLCQLTVSSRVSCCAAVSSPSFLCFLTCLACYEPHKGSFWYSHLPLTPLILSSHTPHHRPRRPKPVVGSLPHSKKHLEVNAVIRCCIKMIEYQHVAAVGRTGSATTCWGVKGERRSKLA